LAESGLALLELLFVISVLLVLLAITTPALLSGLDDFRTHAAARYLAGQCYRARSESLNHGVRVALRFQALGSDYALGRFRDGNGNGIRTVDIARGIDPRVSADVTLAALFGGHVRLAIAPGVPLIDGGFSTDPIRVSGGNLLTFAPNGTASSGSVYLRGAREAQYAVRVFGVTGRTRVFKYMRGTWKPL
jgi:hypothetical protein